MVAVIGERRAGCGEREKHIAQVLLLAARCSLLAFVSMAMNAQVIDHVHREVRITATVQPDAMAKWTGGGVRGHHAVTWRGGNAHDRALFVSDVSDHDVRAALDALGAKRGENLTEDSWNARGNAKNHEPDKRVEGTPIDVFVEWNGKRVPFADLISEEGTEKGAPPKLDFRYGGNERFQKDFRSGCIICLYSCPGGAIGNHAHPIRDYVIDGVVYSSIASRLPPAGTQVTIVLKPRGE
jgi:hypothetical protein